VQETEQLKKVVLESFFPTDGVERNVVATHDGRWFGAVESPAPPHVIGQGGSNQFFEQR
jgi:hypothetical protein